MAGTINSRNSHPISLPKSLPRGSIYVVEGIDGERGRLRVSSRYVVLPGGQRIDFPVVRGGTDRLSSRARRRARAGGLISKLAADRLPPAKKIVPMGGTTP